MKKLTVYDPALCCSTGVCGPSPDAGLAAFASAVHELKGSVEIHRHNLAQEPGAFTTEPLVNQVLQEEGPDALPVLLLDGKVVMKGVYPTVDQLTQLLGVEVAGACDEGDDECCGESGCGDVVESESSESDGGGGGCC